MIERNLGNLERLARLLMGLVFAGWALTQPYMNGIEWFVVVVSLMLISNGIFSRCYLWYVLDLDTSKSSKRAKRQAYSSAENKEAKAEGSRLPI